MRKSYGTTWWGRQWLNALKDIDFSNRLPRGRTYANKGAVTAIQIDENRISASVQGSRRQPYKVNITIPRFDAHTKARIVEAVTGNPLFLSQLLNRQLPAELYEVCLQQGLRIFPRSWNDLDGRCSCPDWAVPCKHLAAVLYLVANEIDKDPFLVFELRSFDLFKALEGVGYTAGAGKKARVLKANYLWEGGTNGQFAGETPAYSEIDYTRIPNIGESLFRILGEQPVFFPSGDFKKELRQAYRSVSRNLNKELEVFAAAEEQYPATAFFPEQVEWVSIILDEELAFLRAEIMASDRKLLATFEEEKLFRWLWRLPIDKVEHLSPSVQQLFWAMRTAAALLERRAFVPQLMEVEEEHYIIRWLPASLDEQVRGCLGLLGERLEEGLLQFEIESSLLPCRPEEGVSRLVSVGLNYFVQLCHGRDYYLGENPVADIFFLGVSATFDAFESREYPNAIQLWLSRFYIIESDLVPALQFSAEDTAFQVQLFLENKKEPLTPLIPLAKIFEEEQYASERVGLLQSLAVLTEFFPQLSRLIASEGKEELYFGPEEFADILFDILPVIRLFGIKILLPKGMRKILRPQLSLSLDAGPEGKVASSGVISLEALLRFNWQVAIGKRHISAEEFEKLARQLSGIVKLQDQYAYFDEKQVKALLDKLENPPALSGRELLQAALAEDYEGAPVQLSTAAKKLMDELLRGGPVAEPEGLKAELRPYQQRGYEWLYKNSRIGFGSLIADDMGLGKTLQVIATLLKLKEEGALGKEKALAIVPTTLLTNWHKEIQKFAPGLSAHVYHGPSRSLEPLEKADLLITTYGVVRSEGAALTRKKWLAVVIDEAQNIKNPATAQSKAVKKLKSPIRMAMTGTPVENRLSEYWSIFDFINRGYLGGLKYFKDNYARPIEVERDQEQLERFRRITAPFILRRVKTDKSIISDLPDKIEKDQYCELTKEQAALYQNVVDNTMEAIEQAEGINRRGLILKLITALKQVCNHPRHFLKKGKADPTLSGKATLLLDLTKQILDGSEKALIFTQYREMGDLLTDMLKEEFGLEPPFLHGGVNRKGRDDMVEDFQNNRATRLMLLSLKAGGTGLNLTAASNVIHYDLWWNPAVENQATDRAYRIGQESNVMVHRFITKSTFEEKINTLLQNKKELADLAVATGEQWVGELGNAELRELVRLG